MNLLERYSIDDPNLNKIYYARRRVESFAYLSFTSILNSLYENENNLNKLIIKFGYQSLLKIFFKRYFYKASDGKIEFSLAGFHS